MAFEFVTATQKQVYEKVAGYLKEQFGKTVIPSENGPSFGMRSGSAWVQVIVTPVNDKFTVVRSFCWVVTGAETSLELCKFLLEANYAMRFGAFSMEPGTGDIMFEHAIGGEGCDSDELLLSLFAVVNTSDDYDDKITQRFGGQRAVDRTRAA
jgi:hypothetical protein